MQNSHISYHLLKSRRINVSSLPCTSTVNSVCWAPHEHGLILACASSDGSVSILTYTSAHTWENKKITNAHSVSSPCWWHVWFKNELCEGNIGINFDLFVINYFFPLFPSQIGCNAVSWAPAVASGSADGSSRTASSVQRIVTGGCDTYVKIWRFDSGTGEWAEESKLEGHSDWVRDVAWAPSIGLPRSIIASCSQVKL